MHGRCAGYHGAKKVRRTDAVPSDARRSDGDRGTDDVRELGGEQQRQLRTLGGSNQPHVPSSCVAIAEKLNAGFWEFEGYLHEGRRKARRAEVAQREGGDPTQGDSARERFWNPSDRAPKDHGEAVGAPFGSRTTPSVSPERISVRLI